MKLKDILSDFNDFYIQVNPNDEVMDLCPNLFSLNFPVSFRSVLRLIFPELPKKEEEEILRYFERKDSSKSYNFKSFGKWYSIEYRFISEQYYFHLFASDSALKKLEEDLTMTQIDPLSGVMHKIAIASFINQAFASKQCEEATLFMLDIDYFKNINDNFGHVFGDQVIIEVSKILKNISKRTKVGRVGGDEFVIFLQDKIDRDGVKNIARLIRYLLDKAIVKGENFPMTATIGIAQYPKDGTTFEDLYACCDKALYRGKQKGRDCHIIYDPVLHKDINSSLPKSTSKNVKVLSIAEFVRKVTDALIDMAASRMEYDRIFKDICDYFNLDRVIIRDEIGLSVCYECQSFQFPLEPYMKIDLDEYVKNFVYDNMFMVNDVLTLRAKDDALYQNFASTNVKSFVQVLLFDEADHVVGFISYELLNERRVWQTAEINYLVIISNLIKGFFLKKRALEAKK